MNAIGVLLVVSALLHITLSFTISRISSTGKASYASGPIRFRRENDMVVLQRHNNLLLEAKRARKSEDDSTQNISNNTTLVVGDNGEGVKARLTRATASLIAKRKEEESLKQNYIRASELASAARSGQRSPYADDDDTEDSSYDLINLTKKIDEMISSGKPLQSMQRRNSRREVHVQHETDSMQSLLGYNHVEGEWSDRNSTTYHVAIVFGKPLIRDQVTIEYATRLRTLAKLLKEEPTFRPSLICFTGGVSAPENALSDAAAGYVYFRHLCASQNINIDDSQTRFWVDDAKSGGNEREAMERIASELWRNYIKTWLKDRPLTERLNQHRECC